MKKTFERDGKTFEIYSNGKKYGKDQVEYLTICELRDGQYYGQKTNMAYSHAGQFWTKRVGAAYTEMISQMLGWEF